MIENHVLHQCIPNGAEVESLQAQFNTMPHVKEKSALNHKLISFVLIKQFMETNNVRENTVLIG